MTRGGGKVYSPTPQSIVKEVRAETEAEATKQCCLLLTTQPAFLYTQDHLPRGGTTHRGGPPTPIINKMPYRLVYRQSGGSHFLKPTS